MCLRVHAVCVCVLKHPSFEVIDLSVWMTFIIAFATPLTHRHTHTHTQPCGMSVNHKLRTQNSSENHLTETRKTRNHTIKSFG